MKSLSSPIYTALFLIFGCVIFRMLSSLNPSLAPNISPLMAVAFIGAMYLPHRWGWLAGPVAFLISDLAFAPLNYRVEGAMFSSWTLLFFIMYALAGGLGILISGHKTLLRIVGGSLTCSLLFYVAANTFSWWHGLGSSEGSYPGTLAGWCQANTMGLPGYEPSWHFLRNAMLGDLFFAFVLLLVLDREFLLGRASLRTAARTA